MKISLFFILLFCFLIFNFSPATGSSCIDINIATKQELEKLTGVGPVLAQRIMDARPFSSLDEIIKVSGIAEGKLASIKEQGLACFFQQQKHQESEEKNESLEVKEKIITEEKTVTEEEKPTTLKSLASVNEQVPEKSGSIRVFLTAAIISLFSGTAILIIKKKMIS